MYMTIDYVTPVYEKFMAGMSFKNNFLKYWGCVDVQPLKKTTVFSIGGKPSYTFEEDGPPVRCLNRELPYYWDGVFQCPPRQLGCYNGLPSWKTVKPECVEQGIRMNGLYKALGTSAEELGQQDY